jgi:phenylpropionate dioxygenase-like ring-hydroxylating dioxygenase large terminal subunit
MMNFPGVHPGLVLNEGSESELDINTITVQFSNNEGEWVEATNGHGGGMWAANMGGMPGKMRVRLSINGDQKTINDLDYVELEMGDMGGMDGEGHMGH